MLAILRRPQCIWSFLQVREQAKVNAARIRQSVKAEKKKQINLLAQQVQVRYGTGI